MWKYHLFSSYPLGVWYASNHDQRGPHMSRKTDCILNLGIKIDHFSFWFV